MCINTHGKIFSSLRERDRCFNAFKFSFLHSNFSLLQKLAATGVIPGSDMTPDAALMKLAYLLARVSVMLSPMRP